LGDAKFKYEPLIFVLSPLLITKEIRTVGLKATDAMNRWKPVGLVVS